MADDQRSRLDKAREAAKAAGLRRESGGGWGAMHHGYPVGHTLITRDNDNWTFWTPDEESTISCASEEEAIEAALLWRDAVVLS